MSTRSLWYDVRTSVDDLVSLRVAQFLAVGAVGAAFDTGLLAFLHGASGVPLVPAKVAAAEGSILLMFLLNEAWTFAGEGGAHGRALARRLLTSNVVRLAGLAVGTAVLLALARAGVWYVAANVVGLGAGFLVNYTCESLVTWRVHR